MWERISHIVQSRVTKALHNAFTYLFEKMKPMEYFSFTRFLLLLLLFISSELWAQTSCSDQLILAQRRYDSGLLDEIPALLEPCIANGFTREEKSNAYKLLIQTYLFSDQPEKADKVMLAFLKEFPEYALLPNDQKEFVNLYNTYRTEPIMRIEAGLGVSTTHVLVKEYFGVNNILGESPSYSSGFGANGEISFVDNLFSNFDGAMGISFSYLTFSYSNTPFPFTNTSATQSNIYLGLPLSMRYNKELIGVKWFVKIGVEPVYLISSNIDISRSRTNVQDPIAGKVDMLKQQRTYDIRPLISLGANVRLGKAKLQFSVGAKFGLVDPMISNQRYSNTDLIQKYYYIPDSYFVNQVFFNAAYVFSIYKPKKIR